MTRRVPLVVVLGAALALTPVARAYLKLGTDVGDRVVQVRWASQSVRYFVTNRDAPGVPASQLRLALERAFAAWTSVSTAAVSSQFVGFTDAEPSEDDNLSVVGFQSRPDLDRVLGTTTFTVDTVTGELLESDIFLNTARSWTVAPEGQTSAYDVESILVHEVGHLLGLGHSALGETTLNESGRRSVLGKRAVMFPIAFPPGNTEDRTLEADDIAALSDVYRTPDFGLASGTVSGRVTLDGRGVFGAHVVAFSSATGASVGGFTLTAEGNFVIGGLSPGVYIVRAEPLDDADVDAFFSDTTAVNADFKPAYAPRLAVVPAGGAASPLEITVSHK